jgi:hypothetical protein
MINNKKKNKILLLQSKLIFRISQALKKAKIVKRFLKNQIYQNYLLKSRINNFKRS